MVDGIDRVSGFLYVPLQKAEAAAPIQASGSVLPINGDAKSTELGPKKCKT